MLLFFTGAANSASGDGAKSAGVSTFILEGLPVCMVAIRMSNQQSTIFYIGSFFHYSKLTTS